MTADIVVQDREELIFLLCEAAEFEHAVMCTYLYAMWSLKREESEGVTGAELEAIGRWRASLRQVAREEMLHLALVNNLLAALGAAPHLWKPEFPVRAGHFPADVVMKLMPFSAAALDHFLYIERPEGLDLKDGKGFDHKDHYARAARPDLLSPVAQDYVSQGHLYHGILRGLIDLTEQWGEEKTFVGHDQAQVSGTEFGLPGLFKVTDLASAKRAIEEIVTQGEGAPAHSETSHYARFAAIKQELAALRARRPAFEPARAAAENPILLDDARPNTTRISDPRAAKVVDLGNAIYALMMRTLAQVFSPAPLPKGLRAGMAVGSTELMLALQLVGEAATRLSANGGAVAAGLTFSLPRSAGQLVQSCAGQILSERTRELGAAATALEAHVNLAGVGPRLTALARRFDELHDRFEEHVTLAVERTATLEPPAPQASTGDPNVAHTKDITVRFDTKRCIHSRHCVLEAPRVFRANTKGAWIHPESASIEHIVRVAMNCPSGAITYARHDGGAPEPAPDVNVIGVRESGRRNGRGVVQARHALPLRPLAEQTLLRQLPYQGKVRCHRRTPDNRKRPARVPRRRACDRPAPRRPAPTPRQCRNRHRHRPHDHPRPERAPLPLRRLVDKTLPRRHARADRVQELIGETKRGTLHPGFGDAITAVFERAKNGRGILSLVFPPRNEGVSVSPILETHDPRYVSALVDRIRNATETAWLKCFSARNIWAPHESLGLVASVLRIDADAAYPLMTTWSGHVREAAVRRVAAVPGPFCLAMLVHRMNDWVDQVRKAAEAKLATLRASIAPKTIVGCIEMLWEVERFGRASPAAKQRVVDLTHTPPVLAMLRAEALEGRTDRAFRIFQRLLRTSELDDIMLAAATTNPHPRIRACATKVVLTQTYRWRSTTGLQERRIMAEADPRSLARTAIADRATIVRLAGLEYVASNGRTWSDYESILLQHATDPRNSLAEMARWGLSVAGVDWIDRLRKRLTEGGVPDRHVARVLGKFGNAADGECLWSIASTLPDDLALSFLTASAQLKSDPAVERLSYIATRAPDLSLARRAARALREVGVFLAARDLKPVADRGNEFFARGLDRHFNGLNVMTQLNILARLERAAADFDIETWFARSLRKINRSAFTVADDEKKELASLLANAPKVRERVQRRLAIAI